jgi:uncharacterized protein YlaI
MRLKKSSESDLGGEPLVVCVTCESVVAVENAESHWISLQGKPVKVWICKGCVRLGRGNQVAKYVMKKEKKGIGR